MAASALPSLRDRMSPPRPPARSPSDAAAEIDRVLALAAALFEVRTAALVHATPDGLAVTGVSGSEADAARAVALRLFESLAASAADDPEARGGVLEEVAPGLGFAAAAAVLSESGRCLGALCLIDPGRLALLSGLQRRLLGEIGDLLAPRIDAAAAVSPSRGRVRGVADARSEAFALFDLAGRCVLRNGPFDALFGAALAPGDRGVFDAGAHHVDGLDERLMRDRSPVGVYRVALSDGAWLSVEERRGPHGRSLIARSEAEAAFGDADAKLLFERCPFPMFVFDRDSRSIVAVNAAALSFYGWDREAFLRLDLAGIGPMPPRDGAVGTWAHRARDGRMLAVSARAVALAHRGRPAVLVTVVSDASVGDLAA